MKQILSFIVVAAVASVVVAAVTSKSKTVKVSANEMEQFKAWQMANEEVTSKPPVRKSVNYQSRKAVSTSQNEAKTTEKKGWSKAAKGTAIGAASGAVIGAVINKRNRAVGAVVGTVLGGGVGYGIGRSMDKKDGRS